MEQLKLVFAAAAAYVPLRKTHTHRRVNGTDQWCIRPVLKECWCRFDTSIVVIPVLHGLFPAIIRKVLTFLGEVGLSKCGQHHVACVQVL